MTIDQIITERSAQLLQTFATGIAPLIEVESAAGLGQMTFLDDFAPGTVPERLGRRRGHNVAVMAGPTGQPHLGSLWVRQGYGGYREAYAEFIAQSYGIEVTTEALIGYDVDHLLNRARAGNSGVLLRVEALPFRSNQLWGALIERYFSEANVAGNQRVRRLMSLIIAAKVAGFEPPSPMTDPDARARLALQLCSLGLPLSETGPGVDTMFEHILRNLP